MTTQVCTITFNDESVQEIRGHDKIDFRQQGMVIFAWEEENELLAFPTSNIYEIFCKAEND